MVHRFSTMSVNLRLKTLCFFLFQSQSSIFRSWGLEDGQLPADTESRIVSRNAPAFKTTFKKFIGPVKSVTFNCFSSFRDFVAVVSSSLFPSLSVGVCLKVFICFYFRGAWEGSKLYVYVQAIISIQKSTFFTVKFALLDKTQHSFVLLLFFNKWIDWFYYLFRIFASLI